MSKVVFPYVARINAREAVVFVSSDVTPPQCAFCCRSRAETSRVASGGRRIDAVYARDLGWNNGVGSGREDPICWTCIREKTHGHFVSSSEWRAAVARFLNALNASDPRTLYCEIQSLG
jgi:hypothetical protein